MKRSSLLILTLFAVASAPLPLHAQTSTAELVAEAEATQTVPTEQAEKDAKPAATGEVDYVRIGKDDDGRPQALQTAIVRYRGRPGTKFGGQVVDLVGVVHIGGEDYYGELNDILSRYDVVLYELVAPDGTRIRPEDLEERRSILASLQTGMKDMLELEYQLEKVDYMVDNFRHADMSPDEFVEDLERRGDSIVKMVARMMGAGMAAQASTGGDTGMLLALFSDDRATALRRTMARQLVDIESVTAGLSDKNGEDTLIKGRNAKAFEILREELGDGKQSLAVFYGAGHLPDMAERLEGEFQMEVVETNWLDAWDLRLKK